MFAGSSEAKHQCLVVDTNAVIRGVHVERMARELFTVPEVLTEIRDQATREGILATLVLPQMKVRDPDPDALEQVIAAAKETGDYPFLSEPDLKAVALTLTLFNERNPEATVPLPPETSTPSKAASAEKKEEEKEKEKEKVEEKKEEEKKEAPKSAWGSGKGWAAVLAPPTAEQKKQMMHAQGSAKQQKQNERDEALRRKTARQERAKAELAKRIEIQRRRDEALQRQQEQQQKEDDEIEEGADEGGEGGEETEEAKTEGGKVKEESAAEAAWGGGEGSDGEGEWITPDNVVAMQARLGGCDVCDTECVGVGCLTGDFAMQNVLLHLALDVVGVEGLRLRAARTWMLRCFSCFAFVRDTNKIFCPQCGNSTLQKVAVETRADGSIEEVSLATRTRQYSQHHSRIALPPPRGGRNCRDPITCEEELQRRLRSLPHPRKDDVASLAFDGRFSGRLTVQQQRKLVNSGGITHHKRTGKKRSGK